MRKKLKIALVCGGPSLERGISLNSARSVLDHLESEVIEIVPFYFDQKKKAYKISKPQLYSNTPSDFDFKLKSTAKSLTHLEFLKEVKLCDIAFPVMHGKMGEDGQIQKIFEENNIPFIASPSSACGLAFNKFYTNELLKKNGFYTLPSLLVKNKDKKYHDKIKTFFADNKIKRGIVKPATGGSSIGVYSVVDYKEACRKTKKIFDDNIDTQVVIEPFAQGREFTIIVLQNKAGAPVALIPTEIETSYEAGAVFDFRKKYLPTHGTMYHNPARFENAVINKIQKQAEEIFILFGMRDFTRIDGWLLDNGGIWFSDINPISGMEQNSFLFQQASRIGLSHRDLLNYVLSTACSRYKIKVPIRNSKRISSKKENKKIVNVLFGGPSSERQVSLMSGTNVWLKLKKSKICESHPYLLDFNLNVWQLPYSFALNHTVEEVYYTVKNAKLISKKLNYFKSRIHKCLGITNSDISEPFFIPHKYTLANFIKKSKFVFLGLHGNPGEDGTLQELLEKNKVKFNGPDSQVSKLCMNKFETGEFINNLNLSGVHSAKQKVLKIKNIKNYEKVWYELCKNLGSKTLIVKPLADGCSSGIFRLFNSDDLKKYIEIAKSGITTVAPNTFKNQKSIIDMPTNKVNELLFENFIETDVAKVIDSKIKYIKKTNWIEVTVGVFSPLRRGSTRSGRGSVEVMNPSITIAEGEVLSVEEKFQGGTGVNITPPPENIISKSILKIIKERIGIVAEKIGIKGYSRIDAFVNIKTGEVSIIEINTLPGLTPSTVIYHQALAENPSMYPSEFLEVLIKNKGY